MYGIYIILTQDQRIIVKTSNKDSPLVDFTAEILLRTNNLLIYLLDFEEEIVDQRIFIKGIFQGDIISNDSIHITVDGFVYFSFPNEKSSIFRKLDYFTDNPLWMPSKGLNVKSAACSI